MDRPAPTTFKRAPARSVTCLHICKAFSRKLEHTNLDRRACERFLGKLGADSDVFVTPAATLDGLLTNADQLMDIAVQSPMS